MKIMYFTGTGNSLYVAKRFKENSGAELFSIAKMLKNKEYDIESDVVGIITPIYYTNFPNIVHEYLSNVKIKAKYIFLVTTYSLFSFDAKSLINKYNFKVNYSTQVKMPSNYLIWHDMKKVKVKKFNYVSKVEQIVDEVSNYKEKNNTNYIKMFFRNIVSKYTKVDVKKEDEKFKIDINCNMCGICEKVCGANNILLLNDLKFLNKCEQCLACIHHCPQNAISHIKEKNKERYINPHVNVREIIKANY